MEGPDVKRPKGIVINEIDMCNDDIITLSIPVDCKPTPEVLEPKPSLPIVILDDDDDDVIEVLTVTGKSQATAVNPTAQCASSGCKPIKSPVVSPPEIINLAMSPSASSSDCSPPPKKLFRRRKRSLQGMSSWHDHRLLHSYHVLVDPAISLIFEPITLYKRKFTSEFKRFNKDIWNHLTSNLQNDKTFTWKMRVRSMLCEVLSEMYPGCSLIAVGSTINGCGAYNSDMDLCLCIQELYGRFNSDRKFVVITIIVRYYSYAIRTLRKISKRMLKAPLIKSAVTIPAKVPILKFWFKKPYDTLEVDLNINNMPGIYNSYLLHYYSRIDDRFPALCLLVKHWAKKADIGDASQGTLNSYSLILMVVHFLQVAADPPILPNLQKLYPDFFANNIPLKNMILFGDLPSPLPDAPMNNKSVGELLIGFFKYYSSFDYQGNGISIARGCVFSRAELPENTNRFKIFIEEPFDLQNTARCVTCEDNWYRIYAAIQNGRDLFLSRNAGPPRLNTLLQQK